MVHLSTKTRIAHRYVLGAIVALPILVGSMTNASGQEVESLVAAVRQHVDTVLDAARDRFSEEPTPLLADAVDLRTMTPPVLQLKDAHYVISNFANQQNFLRVLVGLGRLTDTPHYLDAATALTAYHFDHLRGNCGLLHWGGHRAFDLKSRRFVTRRIHELKHNFPFYEFFWEVNPEATAKFIRAFWNAHVLDWSILDMNRHGNYGRPAGDLWNSTFKGSEPFFAGHGLTFVNTGDDLIFAALMLHRLDGDPGALTWGMRLARQYVNARHPETKLGVYQYSQAVRRADPPEDENAPDFTYSTYGDRTQRQFGPEFGDVALEGYYLPNDRSIYSLHAFMQLQMAEALGDDGEAMRDWTLEGMRAYAERAYHFENNTLTPMFADGTSLEGYVMKRKGYHGSAGTVINTGPAPMRMFLSYAAAYRASEDPAFFHVVRGIARAHDLGEFGEDATTPTGLNLTTTNADPLAIFGLIELHRATDNRIYLDLAAAVAVNIVKQRHHKGMFAHSADSPNASIDAVEALAVLTTAAALQGKAEAIPLYRGGRAYFSP